MFHLINTDTSTTINTAKKKIYTKEESTRIMKKYPDRVPVIVSKSDHCKLPDIDKTKYLVPKDITMGQFMYIIRKRIKLKSTQALFLFFNDGMIVANSQPFGKIYEMYHSKEDGFLHCKYSAENTFG
jgi:GABA(A) receptor-associated protein